MKHNCLNMFRQLPPNSKNCVYVISGGKLEYGGLMNAAERRRIPILTKTRTPGSLGTPLNNKKKIRKKDLTLASLEP